MTMLAALERAYRWMPDAPKPGFALARIGVVVGLNEDGSIASVSPLKEKVGKKEVPRMLAVPAPVKRSVNIAPNTFWDKTAYSLGVSTKNDSKDAARHEAFTQFHRDLIGATDDPGLVAFLRFLDAWSPDRFDAHFAEDMKDENVVFALEGERRREVYLYDRPAARALLEGGEKGEGSLCLVTGARGPVARLHPSIKGIWGGQPSGADIVSFNLEAFESYGHEKGDNAPVSQAAAEAYVGALNRFLANGSGHRMQIGDASVAFWAEAPTDFGDEEKRRGAERLAEAVFAAALSEDEKRDQAEEDEAEAKPIREALQRIRDARPVSDDRSLVPEISDDTRFYVLGLAPNAARISVRFWLDTTFGAIAENYARFSRDMRIEPADRQGTPALWHYLNETAVLGKRENVPPNLAGEWMRAILAGTAYPLTLLSTVLMRIRADGIVNARRAAILKAVLVRNFRMEKEAPVGLDPENTRKGYLLGRLFATYEQAQSAALGRNVNATIKDKFYGSASAQPRKVFSILETGSANHLSKLGKQRPGQRVNLERTIAEIMDKMSPDEDPFPASLPAAEQALFGLGYYHQRSAFFARKDAPSEEPAVK
ncbi:type I-C CRISPR-associated protein Cas8c/Csd1 [Consotaella salsifontis]|uniref:CRISPR-associated protein, Csd1 family n=1 Tax=Consotaella salsifontis TaxID=1365950 RepID=A0A1T4L5Z4_9HYPH|nr:type I-C CRISPR-associated protein Cas8c/Csd1 [Consotaella salsifontis]SJZ49971.1 CRISPR-associated protein, Csd1 family [Consotaella salsifontis]